MITNPILPLWVMILFIPVVMVSLSIDKKKRIRQLIMFLLMVLINLRIMIPGDKTEVITNDLDVLFVVDTTVSMIAEDYDGDKPRMTGVKNDIKKIIDELEGAKFSIVTFDNSSKVFIPYTRDRDILYEAVDMIKTSTYMFARGTTLNASIYGMEKQLEASDKKEKRARIVFFMSDGEITLEDSVDTNSFGYLKDYLTDGVVLGYGTDDGGKMYAKMDAGGSYQYVTYQGETAISKIDEHNLNLVSESLGIDYINMNEEDSLNSKLEEIKDGSDYKFDVIDKHSYNDTYFFFVIPFLGLLIYEFINFRKGV